MYGFLEISFGIAFWIELGKEHKKLKNTPVGLSISCVALIKNIYGDGMVGDKPETRLRGITCAQ